MVTDDLERPSLKLKLLPLWKHLYRSFCKHNQMSFI